MIFNIIIWGVLSVEDLSPQSFFSRSSFQLVDKRVTLFEDENNFHSFLKDLEEVSQSDILWDEEPLGKGKDGTVYNTNKGRGDIVDLLLKKNELSVKNNKVFQLPSFFISPKTFINRGLVILRAPLEDCELYKSEEKFDNLSMLLESFIVKEANNKPCLAVSIDILNLLGSHLNIYSKNQITRKLLCRLNRHKNIYILEVQFCTDYYRGLSFKEKAYIRDSIEGFDPSERYFCFTKRTTSLLKDPQGKERLMSLIEKFNVEKLFIWGVSSCSCLGVTISDLTEQLPHIPLYFSFLLSSDSIGLFRVTILSFYYERWWNLKKIMPFDLDLFNQLIDKTRCPKKGVLEKFSYQKDANYFAIRDGVDQFKKSPYQRGAVPHFVDSAIHRVFELKDWDSLSIFVNNRRCLTIVENHLQLNLMA